MNEQSTPGIDQALANEAVELVRRWLHASRDEPVDAAAKRLSDVLRDENGLAFTVGFVDGVIRPEDPHAAARHLQTLVPLIPRFLSWPLRTAVRLGASLSTVAPGIVIPIAKASLRQMVRHLVVDASERKLGPALKQIRAKQPGARLNINLLGEAILGKEEAARRVEGTRRLLARDDVDYISIKVSSTVAPHSPWSFDEAVAEAVQALVPLFELARTAPGGPKFINLDMEEYKDLDLTLAVFMQLLDRPEFTNLPAGIVLQAYLPDALGATMHLQEWASARVDAGGAPIKIRVVKGANLPMEHVDAEVHNWPVATWDSKKATDASYKAVLDYALHPSRTRAVRVGVAGQNLFDLALAWLLAERRGCTCDVDIEMLLGMATAEAAAIRKDIGNLLLYTPVVHPQEFDVAIAYLVRRLDEGASDENFMSAVFDLRSDESLFERERARFMDSLAIMPTEVPASNRDQDRSRPQPAGPREGFRNTADTDSSVAANRDWAEQIRSRMPTSTLGVETAEAGLLTTREALEEVIGTARSAAKGWQELGAGARAEILHRAGDALEARRADLLEVMGAECGKVIEQGDPEVSEAIDFAHYYAESGRRLEQVEGAAFTPSDLTVVTPPWNFPAAIPAGSTLSALASGSTVVIKPAEQAKRTGAVMVEALWEAGVPKDVLQYVQLSERDLGTELISHPGVDQVILTGGYETAELFRSMRPDLQLLAETSGKNAIIVTPSADLDLAAKDVANSAFGHAGQKCSAASLVILVGSVATSARFHRQLLDAVTSMEVGMPWQECAQVGPVIAPPEGKLQRGLTTLGAGENWVLPPRKLDDDGRLWRPGVRAGVAPGSEYHMTEYFGPILGVMTAETLTEAIEMVNEVEYGLTSGLHSLDSAEIDTWLQSVQAGNLYVNRGITGAIVQRQPFGGWKKSSVGNGTKAGGPNYLVSFGTWADRQVTATDVTDPVSLRALRAAEDAGISQEDRDWLAGALHTDVNAWEQEFGIVRDATGLQSEHNALRYHPTPVTVRFESERLRDLLRILAAAARSGAHVTVSSDTDVAPALQPYVGELGIDVFHEDGSTWRARANGLARVGGRVRLIGGSGNDLARATDGSPLLAIYSGPVVSAGRVELLTFLREQAVSITAHRFGTPRPHRIPASVPVPAGGVSG
ncbi:bifunctional proline dehydrogenase/L-glutamate gamma-semialdehyde dehydrogenase [Pseudactinotalea sp. Z1748]|uniref:bifunctional proline dehydrogenase/L-glutamate gamma-semialdehyde dehydrogenase n=1 Tax=Pseudactinotalea sp. Z1748 TaxID=3413027 RepID=UPI003C7B972D